ncbi:autotransporter outer membrane beta-barrel domain-containing protein [Pantoea sp. EA-12]|uniref:autotransporter outer membrane beta-barrel domain-containing protein n=1 Tax=Pantoea sp. EA-12 TaxID=3043303 RepID=UPI0024B4AA4C|nr:autotransporter outer membrane beta-barrel domain-containing protein [Pantoea sp. EA-12]MDI9222794.1 autotransporter outer membrane beta-barrel domain-containing protein [Pantoea sp. EA-12]
MLFKLKPLALSLLAAQGIIIPVVQTTAAVIQPFDPATNDNKVGVFCVCNGSTQSLTGLPQFAPGKSGEVQVTIGEIQDQGRLVSDNNVLGQPRLSLGAQDYTISVPNEDHRSYSDFQTYNSAALSNLAPVDSSTVVTDFEEVKNQQYIDTRVASVSNGTINVQLGTEGASTVTNGWEMAAKQSRLFTASNKGNMNWDSDNRITFTATQIPAVSRWGLNVDNLVSYNGAFSVTTLYGDTTDFNVTSLTDLQSYNDWLIEQLQNGQISSADYNTEFNKAVTLSSRLVVWGVNTPDDDEAFLPIGERIVLSADGANAHATIETGKTLEVANANGGAMRADNGATATINGKLASTGSGLTDDDALVLTGGSNGINNGVINSGFFNNAQGSGIDSSTLGPNGLAVNASNSHFINNGIINSAGSAVSLVSSSGVNNGTINLVGGNDSGTAVALSGETSTFTNNGTIYLGRTPQNQPGDATTDTPLSSAIGILQYDNSSVINNGHIVVGSQVQSGAAISVNGADDAVTRNNGVIDVNGRGTGLEVIDAGRGGQIGNAGVINLNGDNGTGLMVTANDGNQAYTWSTGPVNISGNANAAGGTRNTAVWVKGTDSGTASADISGPIALNGAGAIGIRAEGNASVSVAQSAIPTGNSSSDQITFLTIGPDAHIALPANGSYGVTGVNSTLFRVQDGANFDGSGMTLSSNGDLSTAVIGSGDNTQVTTGNAIFNLGDNGIGLRIEGAAQGTIDAATTFNMNGVHSIAGQVQGNRTDLTGNITNSTYLPYTNTLLTNNANLNGTQDQQIGFIASSQGQLINNGGITLSGNNATGIMSLGATATNNGTVSVSNGSTGIYAEGYSYSVAARATNNGTINVTAGNASAAQPSVGGVAFGDLGYFYQNGTINLYGDHAVGAQAGNGGTVVIGAGSNIVFHDANQVGYQALEGLSSISNSTSLNTDAENITLLSAGGGGNVNNQGTVTLNGNNSSAVGLIDGGLLINSGSISANKGVALDASSGSSIYLQSSGQLYSEGTAAIRVGSGGSLNIIGDGQGDTYSSYTSSIGAGGNADTVLIDNGAAGFSADHVELYGSSNVINNRAESSNIALNYARIDVNDGNGIRSATSFDPEGHAYINVSGNGKGIGYLFANEDGSVSHNDLTIGPNYYIFVSGNNTGVRANTTGTVTNEGTIAVYDQSGGSAIVTSTASEVINRGGIISLSTVSPIIDLRGGQTRFINQGNISAPFPETIVVAGGASDDQIALLAGSVVGDVNTGNGNDSLQVSGGTLNGSLTMGDGTNQALVANVDLANTRHITTNNGAGSTLNFSDISARGGSFSADDLSKGTNLGGGWSTINFDHTQWTLTDNLKLAHSTINIGEGSTLFAGDGVNPLLSGATDGSLVVNNAGMLDLTNGNGAPGNTLTIDGDLNAVGGRVKLNTQLASGGASDNLRVNGNSGGTTLLDVKPVAGDGAVITPDQGISLVQVTGSASASSFALANGYVASGPYQYGLYSSTNGAAWDYRLANNFISNAAGNAVRPQLTPQMPSYISAPVGLAYYNMAVMDDLHKRLGELRQDQDSSAGNGGEMFIRYLGSNLTYKTDRSLSQYGYDFDLDYSAVQLGGNLIHLQGANDSLRAGVAYTRGNARIRPQAADGYSSTSLDNDTLSLYATWLRDNGLYVDGTLSFDWHRGDTDIARQKDVGKLKGNGWGASLETGYPWQLGNGIRLEPQAQLMYLQLNMDDLVDEDNTRVRWGSYDQTIGRVGAKLDRTWQDAAGQQYTPYLRTNYTRGWGGAATMQASDNGSAQSVSFDSGEFGQMWDVGIGGTATLKSNVSLYAEADYRQEIDGNGTKGWRYNGGVRWQF